MTRFIRLYFVITAFFSLIPQGLQACPFCSAQGQTLLGEVAQADLILFGTTKNAKRDNENYGSGTTELHVEKVVKGHPSITGKNVVILPKYIPADPKTEYKYLVFASVLKDGKLDPYRGVAVLPSSRIADYLIGSIELKGKDSGTRLNYFFQFLDNEDNEIAQDAYVEFGNSSYADFRKMAEKLPADKIAGWLRDPNTPISRFGLYGSMLGHSGKPEHISVFEEFLADPRKRSSSGVDGILAGYVLLDAKKGWDYLLSILKDDKQEFYLRYAALRSLRFLWEDRADVINKKDLVKGVAALLEQGDICDLVIEDLRKWQYWDLSDKVFAVAALETHQVPIVQRSIIRYALSNPQTAGAEQFLAAARAKDPMRVQETEELLKLETTPAVPKKP